MRLGVLLGLFLPVVARARLSVHDKRDAIAHGWEKRDQGPRGLEMSMRIALTQKNLDKAYDYLMEVSDPDSKKYGMYVT